MKNLFVFSFIFLLFSFSLFSLAYAQNQDQPKLALGSIQYQKAASATPGANFSFDIYFFIDEEYGTRTAHIQLGLDYPEGWNVYVFPPPEQYKWNISGVIVNSTENLYIEPRPLLQSIPEQGEEGIYYIASPSGRGYLQAKKATIYVNVPENAKIGESYQISVSAKANYFGGEGSIMFSQSRSFNFDVKIIAPQYTEQLVPEQQEKPVNENNISSNTSSSNISSNESGFTSEQTSGNQSLSSQEAESNIGIYVVMAAVIVATAIIITKYIPSQSEKPYKKDYEKELKKNQKSKKNNNKISE